MYSQYKKGKITLIITACVAVLFAAGITVGVLYFLNKPSGQPQHTTTTPSITAASIVESFQRTPPAALTDFSQQLLVASDVTVSVKSENASYGISVQSDAAMLFSGYNPEQKAGHDAVLADSDTIFKQIGLEKQVTYPSGATYTGKGLVCQLDTQMEPVFVATIACIKDEAVRSAYQDIEKLVSLYNAQADDNERIREPLQISRIALNRDNVKGAILSVQYTESVKAGSYLFGAIDGQWQYVSSLTGGISTGKTNIPETALPIVKDAKWKGVLTELTGVEG